MRNAELRVARKCAPDCIGHTRHGLNPYRRATCPLRNIVVSLACSASRYSLFLHLTAFVVTSFISFAPAFFKLDKRALNHSAAPPLPKQS
ncbi:MAG: hypothetical protein IKN56_01150, partial [Clostridia bacterium]|nr:hypothetical protein [Clostridia bacterium]